MGIAHAGAAASQDAISTSLNDTAATLDDLNYLEDRFIQNVRTMPKDKFAAASAHAVVALGYKLMCPRTSVDRRHHPAHQELGCVPRVEVHRDRADARRLLLCWAGLPSLPEHVLRHHRVRIQRTTAREGIINARSLTRFCFGVDEKCAVCANYSDSLAGVWFAAGYLGLMLIIPIVGITLTAKRLIRAAEKDNIVVRSSRRGGAR